jgi:hypothetical protein
MTVEQIDPFRLQSLQAAFARLEHILRISPHFRRIHHVQEAEFGRQKNLVALASALEPLAEEIISVTVDVGTVPVRLTECIGAVEVGEAFFVAAAGAVGTS